MTRPSPLVVGILYPPEWFGSDSGFAAELEEIANIDPSIEVVTVTYVEPHEVRTARGSGLSADEQPAPQPISDHDLAEFKRINVALAIDLPPNIVELAPNLKWVQAVGSGTAHLQAAGLAEAGITLTSNGGANSVGIAEFVFGRLIESRKRFRSIAAAQADHRWEALYGEQLAGQTLGLIGYGAINQAVAKRAAAFEMTVLATRRSPNATPVPPVEQFFGPDGLHEMLNRCDAVIAAVPETAETEALMNAEAFAAMRKGAFFANVGRGTLVDETALIETLRSGRLGSAAIDVALVEPLPTTDPLWDAPRLMISGHCSTVPTALIPNLHRLFRANIERLVADEELTNIVPAGRGY